MDFLLAAMLLLGNQSDTQQDMTMNKLLLATIPKQTGVAGQGNTLPVSGTTGGKVDPQKDAPIVKGVYATAHTAAGSRMQSLLTLLDETELNSMVIDIKDDWGYVTYDTKNPAITALGTTKPIIKDMSKLMNTLEQHKIYPIARIVVFKDSVLAKQKPNLSFIKKDGTVWKNGKGDSFVNPYVKQVWDYNISVAKEAAKAGFKEIQFDYVRFPEGFEKKADTLGFYKDKRKRTEAVQDFVKYAREQLASDGIRISVDIFGYAAAVPAAEGIGQDFVKISENVDVICPMIYPSHYSEGWYGAKVPDAAPYQTIAGATKDTHKKLVPIGAKKPIIRPWIQDFTASWIPGHIRYGKKELDAQIKALKDNGVEEYLLWNSGNRYTQHVKY
ncbi:GTP-binding protein [Paenibacillus swuensis]|uniref:GTP-binding protein n=1 Tax=Paenibacillus swuensis TaxID=1178515 RepID=A0A172TN95_9BACL|nr:putative glycoside hydrolase [Paenibacillus swuensis]ANE48297.1 GTP-binding protein [Paenibacillus swuensis]